MQARPLIADDPYGLGAGAPASGPARRRPSAPRPQSPGQQYVDLSAQLFAPTAEGGPTAEVDASLIVGIDPGITGAIAVLRGPRLIECHDMPVMARSASKKSTKQEVNAAALAAILRRLLPIGVVYVERVNAMPNTATQRGMGAASAFNFGDSFGRILGVLAALEVPYELVHPVSWKRRAGIPSGSDKDYSRTLAQQLFPGAELSRKKDVGRADAILIARYGHV